MVETCLAFSDPLTHVVVAFLARRTEREGGSQRMGEIDLKPVAYTLDKSRRVTKGFKMGEDLT